MAAAPPTFTPMPSPQPVEDTAVPPTTTDEPTIEQPTLTTEPSATVESSPTIEPSDTPPPDTVTPTPAAVSAATGDGEDNGESPSGDTGGSGDDLATRSPIDIIRDLPRSYQYGGLAAILLALYVLLYAAGAANAGRYSAGFVIETCPVCQKGELEVVNRKRRPLGIPRVRRTVHCDYCGSVLRQVGRARWRYTVDGDENPTLFEQYNGHEITDRMLIELGAANRYQMVPPEQPENFEPPEYVDGE